MYNKCTCMTPLLTRMSELAYVRPRHYIYAACETQLRLIKMHAFRFNGYTPFCAFCRLSLFFCSTQFMQIKNRFLSLVRSAITSIQWSSSHNPFTKRIYLIPNQYVCAVYQSYNKIIIRLNSSIKRNIIATIIAVYIHFNQYYMPI